jgi:hypothetical protein
MSISAALLCPRNALGLLTCITLVFATGLQAADNAMRGIATGSGVPGEKVVQLAPTARKLTLEVPGTVRVRLEPRGSPRVTVRFDRNLLDLISVTSTAESVKIGMSGSFQSTLGLRIDVVLNAMEALAASGSGDVGIERLNEPRLLIDSTGSGNVAASGRVERLAIRLSGSGDISASNLAAAGCEMSNTGSGNTSLRCSESVSGELSGAGDLSVAGKPKRRAVGAHGAGEVTYE